MATRVVRLYGGKESVSIFEFDKVAAECLSILEYDKPSTEWAHFVMNNRNRSFDDLESPVCNHDAKYDIVIGPVANDDMALLFRQYTENLLTLEALSRGLQYREATDQYSFHTKEAIILLHFKGVYNE